MTERAKMLEVKLLDTEDRNRKLQAIIDSIKDLQDPAKLPDTEGKVPVAIPNRFAAHFPTP
jgi:hypothetical protein